jgi:hypothetical protein
MTAIWACESSLALTTEFLALKRVLKVPKTRTLWLFHAVNSLSYFGPTPLGSVGLNLTGTEKPRRRTSLFRIYSEYP